MERGWWVVVVKMSVGGKGKMKTKEKGNEVHGLGF